MAQDPKCPQCGSPLDIVIDENGNRSLNDCTNPDCPSNTVYPQPSH
jgi:hypothetical protein